MKIGVDLRAFDTPKISGVKIYLESLLTEILRADRQNQYILWWNSKHRCNFVLPKNSRGKILHTHFSNRLLNLGFWSQKITLEKILKTTLNVFWLPDPRPIFAPQTKIITTFHDLSFLRYPGFFSFKTRLWHKFLRAKELALNSHRILAVSRFTAQELQTCFGIDPRKISVTSLATNLQKPGSNVVKQVRRKFGLPPNFIFAIGTLERRKNFRFLAQAVAQLKAGFKFKTEFVLAGEADPRIFTKVCLPKFVRQIGRVSEVEKAALFVEADVVVVPSLYEGFGLPVLEALQMGAPLVVARIPALSEVTENCAAFFDPRNLDSLVLALAKVLTDSDFQHQIVRAGRVRAADFSWQRTAQKTLEAFSS